ncbi:helix-turn-helix domain-containing protein [Lacticaseibacillus jixiensis]|uniref:helix-turn-helix domain-containing protein n=1 Tax=Lacticaseibacillus jixiensis TaxID=3231926 RepID=UPI0036F240DD
MSLVFDRISKQAKAKRISLQDLAEAAGLSRSAIYAWDKPDAKPRHSSVAAIAKALDVNTDYLLGSLDDPGYFKTKPLSRRDQFEALQKSLAQATRLADQLARPKPQKRGKRDPDVEELADLIQQLDPEQRRTLRSLVTSMLN